MEGAQTQVPDNLHALHCVDVMVHIAHLDTCALEVGGQILGHTLGEGRHKNPLVPGGAGVDFADEVINLPFHRADLNHWVQQSGGPDNLFHNLSRPGALVFPGGGGDIDNLVDPLFKFLKFQRPVVEGAGKAEAILHQGVFAGAVAVVHGPDLGQGDVALIDE